MPVSRDHFPGLFRRGELGWRHPVGVEEGGGDVGDVTRGAGVDAAQEPVVHVGVERVLLLAAKVVVDRLRRLLHLDGEGAEPQDAGVLLRCLKQCL